MISIEVNDQAIRQALDALVGRTQNTRPALAMIGEYLLTATQGRFDQEVSPDGTPWVPLHPASLAEKQHSKDARIKDKILQRSGQLKSSLRWQLLTDGVVLGTNRPYAAIHQFGGTIKPQHKKALAFGGRLAGSVTMPARPFLGISAADSSEIVMIIKGYLLIRG